MKKITDPKVIRTLTLLCIFAYFVSYLTRKDFAAILAAFTAAEGVEKSAASIVTVALFVCYGTGQLLSGYLGDRVSPRRMITVGLLVTAAMNLLMPFLGNNITLMAVFWGINGVAQAMMWPPMIKILIECQTTDDYRKAVVNVCWGSSLGTIGVYLLSSLFVRLFDSWRLIFPVVAAVAVVMAIVWERGVARVEAYREEHGTEIVPDDPPSSTCCAEPTKDKASPREKPFNPFTMSPIILIFLAIVFQGMLRDGLESWMPSYLAEGYGLATSGAILSSVVMPLFTLVCIRVTAFIFRKWFRNELTCSAAIFATGAVASFFLYLFHGKSAALAVLLVSLVAAAMHGVNLILVCMVPSVYEKYGNVSFVSGLLNACTYIGSALFTYGIARIAEVWDWKTTVLSWALVGLCGVLICALAIIPWRRFKARK